MIRKRRWSKEKVPGGYNFFRGSVKAALRAGMDAMIQDGCDVALLARISCGIYSGPYYQKINADFKAIVTELLSEELEVLRDDIDAVHIREAALPRGCYFTKVVVPMLPQ